MKSQGSQTINMLDNGFTKVCEAVNDVSFIVRTQAAKLMVRIYLFHTFNFCRCYWKSMAQLSRGLV